MTYKSAQDRPVALKPSRGIVLEGLDGGGAIYPIIGTCGCQGGDPELKRPTTHIAHKPTPTYPTPSVGPRSTGGLVAMTDIGTMQTLRRRSEIVVW